MDRRRLIAEYVRSIVREGEVPSWARWFHISTENLGDEFTFTFEPRIPRYPAQSTSGTIEDDTTPRVSWAPSIGAARRAMGRQRPGTRLYVYAAVQLNGEVDVSANMPGCVDRLSTPGNRYGSRSFERWRYEDSLWDDRGGKPPAEVVSKAFKGCVPDAASTEERWATGATPARLIMVMKA